VARPAKPWFRKDRDQWVVILHGKWHVLAKGKRNRNLAYRAFIDLTSKVEGTTTSRTLACDVCRILVEHARVNLKPNTYESYKRFLDPFAEYIGRVDGNEVEPRQVTQYIESHANWGRTTRFNCITAIKRAWKWAHEERHITLNPLAGVKKPKPERRAMIPDEKDIKVFLNAAKHEFGILVKFLNETGCRPGEAMMLQKRHVYMRNREVRFQIGEDKTSGKTDKARVIHLNDAATKILEELIQFNPSGPLFRNSRGNPWTRYAVNCAVRRIRKLTGLDNLTVAYMLRHNWITDALAQGTSVAIVAELSGNSPAIVAKVYSHLSEKKALLMDTANRVRPKSQEPAREPMGG
jgi:integrase